MPQSKIPTVKEQWDCAMLVLLSHFTVELPQIWYVSENQLAVRIGRFVNII